MAQFTQDPQLSPRRVEEVSDLRQLVVHEQAWRELVSRSDHATIFDTYEWITAWLEAFWQGRAIRFLFFWEHDTLVGVAPLLVDESGEVWCASSVVTPVNRHGYRTSVICAGDPTAVLGSLLKHVKSQRGFARLAFPNSLASVPVATPLPALAERHGLSSLVFLGTPSPILRVSGDWESFLRSKSSHLERETRRKVKRFHSAGRTEIAVVTKPQDCERAMRDIVEIEKNSWKDEANVSLNREPRLTRLHSNFAFAAASSGLLRLYVLYLDGKPLAYIFGVVFRNEYYAFKTAYDSSYRTLSPGIVLFDRMFRDAFDQRLDVVDLGPGSDMRWKSEFANDVRDHVNVCVFNPQSVRCQCCSLYQRWLRPFIKATWPGLSRAIAGGRRNGRSGSHQHDHDRPCCGTQTSSASPS